MLVATLVIIFILVIAYLCLRPSRNSNIYDKIYFDNNSTTPPHKEVVKMMADSAFLGNASASYSFSAQMKLDELRDRVLVWCGAPKEKYQAIITSGASESNNLIIRGVVDGFKPSNRGVAVGQKPHLILSSIEHKTSIDCAKTLSDAGRADVSFIAPNIYGQINPLDVAAAIRPATALISIMHANNELGTINDIKAISEIARAAGVPFHTDAVQTIGKTPLYMNDKGISAASMSFHKMNGPMGLGMLIIDRTLAKQIVPQIAGSQNEHLRGGTENVPAIAGANVAMDLTLAKRAEKNSKLEKMKQTIISELSDSFIIHHYKQYANKSDDEALAMVKADIEKSVTDKNKALIILGPVDEMGRPDINSTLPNTLLVAVVNLPGGPTGVGDAYQRFCNVKLKSDLASDGVFISIGSACLTSLQGPSHVLKAIEAPFIIRCGVVRISLGDINTEAQCHEFCKKFVRSAWLQ